MRENIYHYTVRGVDSAGVSKDIVVQASTEDDALSFAREHGIFPTKVWRSPAPVVPPQPPKNTTPKRPFSYWSGAAIGAGLVMIVRFVGCYDTTVEAPNGDYVYNTGLMQNQQLGVMIGIGLVVVGVILLVSRNRAAEQRRGQ